MKSLVLPFGISAALLMTLIGCSGDVDIAGTPLEGDQGTGADAGTAPGTPATGGQCTEPAGAVEKLADPSVLPACSPVCDGARCVPGDKVPASAKKALATCNGGYCVPDSIIKSGGAKPPSCKSLNAADGVCLSVCVPQVAQYKDLLPQATCAADERCAPCISPLDNTSTGACDLGAPAAAGGTTCVSRDAGGAPRPAGDSGPPATATCPHVGPPVLNPTSLPACGPSNSGAHCLSKSLVPPALASQLAVCPTGLCVPDKLIASGGNFISASCVSISAAEGRCVNQIIPQVAAQPNLPQSTCDANERCAPCFNPLDGKDTGVCKLSCDPGPTKPAVFLTDCCAKNGVTEGKCAPTSSIPAALQSNLKTDKCVKNTELCVPTENLQATFKPPTCSGSTLFTGKYTGVCLSECLDFGIKSLGIARGDCDKTHKCVPCIDPTTKKPSGAPGCAP